MNPGEIQKKQYESEENYLLDITQDHCPMTFVKTRLALDKMLVGEKLEIILKNDEPLKNIPRSARELGHKVGPIIAIDGNRYRLIIEKV
jgi:tRNA 2-thiouridine synthesizing protein A